MSESDVEQTEGIAPERCRHMRAFLMLLPLLVIYLLIAGLRWGHPLVDDEGRYFNVATHLAFQADSTTQPISLWSAPGYPLFMAPFMAIGLKAGALRLLNAPLLFGAVWFFYLFLANHIRPRRALCGAWLLGLYFPIWKLLPMLMSETLAVCLVCFLFWSWSAMFAANERSQRWIAMSAFALAWLSLTRAIFGYVTVLCGMIWLVCLLCKTERKCVVRLVCVHVIALVLCLPWLGYTYSRTGKVFYWAAAGGQSLYWMSTPVPSQWGDWCAPETALSAPEYSHHHAILQRARGMAEHERDDLLRVQAIANIRQHPTSYVKNIAANISRMLFSFPYSYTPQKMTTLFYVVPNALVINLLVAAVALLARRPRKSLQVVYPYVVFGAAAFGGAALLSAFARMLFPLIPILLFVIFYGLREIDLKRQS